MKRTLSGTMRLLALLGPMVFGGLTAEAALTIGAVRATDVTPSGFSVSWQASSASSARIAVYADAAGTTDVTTFVETRAFPVQGGDPAVADSYLARRAKAALQGAVQALGLAKLEVQGCAPDTVYYYRVSSEGAGGEMAIWPETGLSSVRTAKENSFVAESRQLLVTILDGGAAANATGWLVRASTPEALAPVSAIVGDGAGANRAYLNLSQLFGSDGLNWTPLGAKDLDLEVLGGPSGPVHQTVSILFNGGFSVANLQEVTVNGGQTFTVAVAAAPPEGGTVTGAGAYNAGAAATLTATANAGYRFVNWSGDASGTTSPLELTVDAAKSVTAHFVQVFQVTVAPSPEAGGTVGGSGTFDAGALTTLTATANPGYRFVNWSGDASGTTSPLELAVDAAKSVAAHFVQVFTVTVAPSPEAGGTVGGSGTFDAGALTTLTATANAGYRFVNWSGDASGTTSPLEFTVDAAKAVTANFVALGPPTLDPIGPQAVDEGQLLAFAVTSADPDQDPVTVTASGLPEGAHFDGAAFRWVPTYRQAGRYEVVFSATDGTLTGAPVTVVVDVGDVPQDPSASAGAAQTVPSGATVVLDGSGSSDADGAVAAYRWVQTAGRAVALSDAASPQPSFVAPLAPGASEALSFELTVTDDSGRTATAATSVTVQNDTFSMPLRAGWNLVSFPVAAQWWTGDTQPVVPLPAGTVVGQVSSVRDALASIDGAYVAVRSFDIDGAHSYDPALPDVFNDLTYLAGGYGYWVKMKQDATLTLHGPLLAPAAVLGLPEGWHLVGYWGGAVRHVGPAPEALFEPGQTFVAVDSVGQILASLEGKVVAVRSFDADGAHSYDPLLPDVFNDLTYLGPGYGYWVKLNAGGGLRY